MEAWCLAVIFDEAANLISVVVELQISLQLPMPIQHCLIASLRAYQAQPSLRQGVDNSFVCYRHSWLILAALPHVIGDCNCVDPVCARRICQWPRLRPSWRCRRCWSVASPNWATRRQTGGARHVPVGDDVLHRKRIRSNVLLEIPSVRQSSVSVKTRMALSPSAMFRPPVDVVTPSRRRIIRSIGSANRN